MLWTGVPWYWYHRQSITLPIVKSFFQILRNNEPTQKIGVAGFCWGGRYALLLGQKSFSDTPLVDAVFAGHPSLTAIPTDVVAPIVPVSIAVASTDRVFSVKMAQETEKLWKELKVKNEIVVYEGAKHGFCLRGNMNNEEEKTHMKNAVYQVYL